MGVLYPDPFLNVGGGPDRYDFSFNEIVETIRIKQYQQMVVYDEIFIHTDYELIIDGELVLVE